MNRLNHIFSRIFGRRRRLYSDLTEEMRQHLEEKTQQFIRDGLSQGLQWKSSATGNGQSTATAKRIIGTRAGIQRHAITCALAQN